MGRLTSAGQRHDSVGFLPLMGQLKVARRGPGRPRTRPGRVLGDKAYSSTAIRAHLRSRGIKATIPEPADQVKNRLKRGRRGGRPPAFDAAAYKQRNTVERAFCQLRQYRAVATRYDKRDYVLARNHRHGLDPDLAPPSRFMSWGLDHQPGPAPSQGAWRAHV